MKGKTRRTKNQKLRTNERRDGFTIKSEWLETKQKTKLISPKIDLKNNSFFRQDLTKTLVLTMLVLALELALWHYLSRQ